MKAVIQLMPGGAGRLHLHPTTETEAFALKCWHDQYINGGSSELQVHGLSDQEIADRASQR